MAVGDCGVVGAADLFCFCDERDGYGEVIMGKWVDDDDDRGEWVSDEWVSDEWVSDDRREWVSDDEWVVDDARVWMERIDGLT